MKSLVDPHVLLWWAAFDENLSQRAREIIEDAGNEIFFSTASAWEISIKYRLGKLVLPLTPEVYIPELLENNQIQVLQLYLYHALALCSLPLLHKDPFDRMLIAQSILENMPIISMDGQFSKYGVDVICRYLHY